MCDLNQHLARRQVAFVHRLNCGAITLIILADHNCLKTHVTVLLSAA